MVKNWGKKENSKANIERNGVYCCCGSGFDI